MNLGTFDPLALFYPGREAAMAQLNGAVLWKLVNLMEI